MTLPLPSTKVRHPKAEGYNALVDDTWFRSGASPDSPVRIYTKDSLASRSDDDGSVIQNVLDIGYAWARQDLSGGEGLDWDPRELAGLTEEIARDKIRFWDSRNIDTRRPVRGFPYEFCLSPLTEIWQTQAGLVDIATSDQYIYVAFGNSVQRWDSWDAVTPIDTITTTTDIKKIVASPTGDLCAVLDDGTVETFTAGAAGFVIVALTDAENTWFAKGRFIVATVTADITSLQEVTAGVALPIFETVSGIVHSMVGSGPGIVAACSDGTLRTYVPEQANQTDPASVSLVIRGRTDVPEGEVPYLVGSNASVLLILTRSSNQGVQNTIRCYQAEVLDARFDYVVGQLNLRREWIDAYDTIDIHQNMASSRDEVWFQVQEVVDEDSSWRFDLVTNGLNRQLVGEYTSAVALILFDDRAGVISGTDIWYTGDLYQDEGYVISPNITFGLNTDISWLATVMRAINIESSGTQIEMYYSTDPTAITNPDISPGGPWSILSRISSPGQAELSETIVGLESRSIALQVRIYSTEAQSKTPCVSRFAIRGIPVHRDWILEVPVNVSDYVEVPGRMPVRVPGYGDSLHTQLLNKVGRSIDIDVLDPPFLFTGIIDAIMEPVTYISERGASSVRAVVQARGAIRGSSSSAVGDAGLGLGTLGITTLGTGQTVRT